MNEITVRNSRVSDTESIYKLLRVIADLHRTARPDMFDGLISKYTESEVEKRLSNEDNGVFVAEIEGAVVGYVFCEVIKEAEDSDATILRFYESKNMTTNVNITLGIPAEHCYVCDLMENEIAELPIVKGKVNTSVHGFEILTLKVK